MEQQRQITDLYQSNNQVPLLKCDTVYLKGYTPFCYYIKRGLSCKASKVR